MDGESQSTGSAAAAKTETVTPDTSGPGSDPGLAKKAGVPENSTAFVDGVRVIIRGLLAGATLLGFFALVVYLIRILPLDDDVPGEYYLFLGQVLGVLAALVTNMLAYYFGSSDSKNG